MRYRVEVSGLAWSLFYKIDQGIWIYHGDFVTFDDSKRAAELLAAKFNLPLLEG